MVADIKSERRPASNRNRWPDCVGIRRPVEIGREVGHRRQKIDLESIDRFDEGDAAHSRHLAGRLVKGDTASTFLLGWRRSGEMAKRRVERAADQFRAHRGGAFDYPFDMLQRGRALFRRLPDRVHVDAGEKSNCRGFEAEQLQAAPELCVMSRLPLEGRNLDAIIARPLQILEDRPMFGLDVGGPQQQVKPILTSSPPLGASRFGGRTKTRTEFIPKRHSYRDGEAACQSRG